MSETIAIRDYPSLIRAIVARRHQLGLSQLELEHKAGLAEGHVSKIEYGGKRLGEVSLPCILQSLSSSLILVPETHIDVVIQALATTEVAA